MNTLPRAIIAQFFTSAEYMRLHEHWSCLVRSARKHELSAAHHLLYLALVGKDWRRGFTPPSNSRRLANGAFHGWALFRALTRLHARSWEDELLTPFDGIVTPQMVDKVRGLIPYRNSYSCRVEQFEAGNFPFDAYAVSGALPSDAPGQDVDNA